MNAEYIQKLHRARWNIRDVSFPFQHYTKKKGQNDIITWNLAGRYSVKNFDSLNISDTVATLQCLIYIAFNSQLAMKFISSFLAQVIMDTAFRWHEMKNTTTLLCNLPWEGKTKLQLKCNVPVIKGDPVEQVAKGRKSTLEVRSSWDWGACWPTAGLKKDSKVKVSKTIHFLKLQGILKNHLPKTYTCEVKRKHCQVTVTIEDMLEQGDH